VSRRLECFGFLRYLFARFVYQSDCIKGRSHKKLKAGGENNIIRDYFHSSAGFSPRTQKQQERRREWERDCPWIIDFSACAFLSSWFPFRLCRRFVDPCSGEKLFTHQHPPSGFWIHEFLNLLSFFCVSGNIFVSSLPPRERRMSWKFNQRIFLVLRTQKQRQTTKHYLRRNSIKKILFAQWGKVVNVLMGKHGHLVFESLGMWEVKVLGE
jgi:hypothetical protein